MSLIGKGHPATANAFLVLAPYPHEAGPRPGDVVTLAEISARAPMVGVEIACPAKGQRRSDIEWPRAPWAMWGDELHPLDHGARAALALVTP